MVTDCASLLALQRPLCDVTAPANVWAGLWQQVKGGIARIRLTHVRSHTVLASGATQEEALYHSGNQAVDRMAGERGATAPSESLGDFVRSGSPTWQRLRESWQCGRQRRMR